ncbi:MAG: V-type ATP synthase subunit I [Oscillospiraceae bacterium]
MSIVKMKHLRALGLREGRGKLLRRLRSLGCVEISTPKSLPPEWDFLSAPDGDELSHHLGEADELSAALEVLRSRGIKDKGGLLVPLPQVAEETLFDESAYNQSLVVARQINEANSALNAQQAKRSKLETQLRALEPWKELSVPLDMTGTRRTDAMFVAVSLRLDRAEVKRRLDEATELYDLTWAGTDREFQYFMVLVHKSAAQEVQAALLDLGCARLNLRSWSGTAAENCLVLQRQLGELDREAASLQKSIDDQAGSVFDLKVALDKAGQEVTLERAKARLLDTEYTFFLDGWFPAEREEAVKAALEEHGMAYDIADPTEEEYPQVPIQLKSNKLTDPFTVVTAMYSMPAYDGVDPNPFMAPFFILFFGFMMNDIGYGLLMALGTALFLAKARPKGDKGRMMSMFFMCGLSSIFWGSLTGSFFGDFFPQLFKLIDPSLLGLLKPPIGGGDPTWFWPALFNPVNNTIQVMIGSMALGVIQVFTGMAISMVEKLKRGEVLDAVSNELAWYCILIGATLAIGGPMAAPVLGTVGQVLLFGGLGLLLIGNLIRAKGLGGLVGFGGAIYNGVSGYFSDILSYLRLMALMMAGAIIAQVFNTLGAVFGLVPFIIVALIGNVLNLVLNLLGCYVHTLRLQCLEFFGRFYKDGGKAFDPLAVHTNYVEVIKGGN